MQAANQHWKKENDAGILNVLDEHVSTGGKETFDRKKSKERHQTNYLGMI